MADTDGWVDPAVDSRAGRRSQKARGRGQRTWESAADEKEKKSEAKGSASSPPVAKAESSALKPGSYYIVRRGACFYNYTRDGCMLEKKGKCARLHDKAERQRFIKCGVFLCRTLNDNTGGYKTPCGALFDANKKDEAGEFYQNCIECCVRWTRSRPTYPVSPTAAEEKKSEEKKTPPTTPTTTTDASPSSLTTHAAAASPSSLD